MASIMDVGFTIGEDPEAERRRFMEIVTAIAVLYVGIWLVGFHVMVPLWMFVYLRRYARVNVITALTVASAMLAIIYSVYDYLIAVAWNEPLVLQLIH